MPLAITRRKTFGVKNSKVIHKPAATSQRRVTAVRLSPTLAHCLTTSGVSSRTLTGTISRLVELDASGAVVRSLSLSDAQFERMSRRENGVSYAAELPAPFAGARATVDFIVSERERKMSFLDVSSTLPSQSVQWTLRVDGLGAVSAPASRMRVEFGVAGAAAQRVPLTPAGRAVFASRARGAIALVGAVERALVDGVAVPARALALPAGGCALDFAMGESFVVDPDMTLWLDPEYYGKEEDKEAARDYEKEAEDDWVLSDEPAEAEPEMEQKNNMVDALTHDEAEPVPTPVGVVTASSEKPEYTWTPRKEDEDEEREELRTKTVFWGVEEVSNSGEVLSSVEFAKLSVGLQATKDGSKQVLHYTCVDPETPDRAKFEVKLIIAADGAAIEGAEGEAYAFAAPRGTVDAQITITHYPYKAEKDGESQLRLRVDDLQAEQNPPVSDGEKEPQDGKPLTLHRRRVGADDDLQLTVDTYVKTTVLFDGKVDQLASYELPAEANAPAHFVFPAHHPELLEYQFEVVRYLGDVAPEPSADVEADAAAAEAAAEAAAAADEAAAAAADEAAAKEAEKDAEEAKEEAVETEEVPTDVLMPMPLEVEEKPLDDPERVEEEEELKKEGEKERAEEAEAEAEATGEEKPGEGEEEKEKEEGVEDEEVKPGEEKEGELAPEEEPLTETKAPPRLKNKAAEFSFIGGLPDHKYVPLNLQTGKSIEEAAIFTRYLSLQEVDGGDSIVRSLDLQALKYDTDWKKDDKNTVIVDFRSNEESVGVDPARISFQFQLYSAPNEIAFGPARYKVQKGSDNWTLRVREWNFAAPTNRLRLVFRVMLADKTPLKPESQEETEHRIVYACQSGDVKVSFGLLKIAQVDRKDFKKADVSFEEGNVEVTLPVCEKEIFYD